MSTYIRVKNLKFHLIIKRCYASESKGKSKKYSKTIRLPITNYPLWINVEKRAEIDSKIEENSKLHELYAWQREKENSKEYVLHDGPPYANGVAHMGHAINKVLKDIVLRHKYLNGYKIHYVPGWDCHGLPIELKVISGEHDWSKIPAMDLRRKARDYATVAIKDQKEAFKTWGIMADWDQQCYYTYTNDYVKNQLRQFYNLYEKEYIYRDLKPVYWSPSSKTALAEGELEYENNHISKAVTLKVLLSRSSVREIFPFFVFYNVYALIWTTTPWTLPANAAIAFSENLDYSVIRMDENSNNVFLIATDLISSLEKLTQKTAKVLKTISGNVLHVLKYQHLFNENELCPFIAGSHVSSSKGTGLVHIAPAHGPEDFVLGLKNNLPLTCVVDDSGRFTDQVTEKLRGLDALETGNTSVLNMLSENIIFTEDFHHSYPYDWRTKKPVIIRASEQWFIDTEKLKSKAFKCLENVNILPKSNSVRLISLLQTRPFWCISRQRVWGVPIPVLYDSRTNKPILNRDLIEHYCALVDEHGTDFWWNLPTKELLHGRPESSESDYLIKKNDILDIWFDSGISWSSVLDKEKVADLYVEGLDQCTGWFQSSLLTSVGIRNIAPFKNLFIHGFAVDKNGYKMSKSVGNVINPQDLIRGSKNQVAYGIDVLRWWVANHAVQTSKIPVTETTLKDSKECVQKLRHVTKFLLGTLHEYTPDSLPAHYFILDKYMLHKLFQYSNEMESFYDDMLFHKICSNTLYFINNDISSLYLHLTKDRLYCDPITSDSRVACQHVCYSTLETILRTIAPIVPHFAEEVYSYHPVYADKLSYFKKNPMNVPADWSNQECENLIKKVFDIKADILPHVSKDLKLNQLNVTINASASLFQSLMEFSEIELLEILQVSSILINENSNETNFKIIVEKSKNTICDRCRKYACAENEELCVRCVDAISDTDAVSAESV